MFPTAQPMKAKSRQVLLVVLALTLGCSKTKSGKDLAPERSDSRPEIQRCEWQLDIAGVDRRTPNLRRCVGTAASREDDEVVLRDECV